MGGASEAPTAAPAHAEPAPDAERAGLEILAALGRLNDALEPAHPSPLPPWRGAAQRRLLPPIRIPPRLRAVKQEQKHYHYDWSVVPDEGPRFENLVASHLLKWIHFQFDSEGRELELRYFRDVDGREVDFVVVERRKPILMVEAKLTAGPLSPSVRYLKQRFPACDAIQVHLRGPGESVTGEGVRLWTAARFLRTLV